MEELARLLRPYRAYITYTPLKTEVDASRFVELTGAVSYAIAPRASLDPAAEALAALSAIGSRPAAILIPGRRFDKSGTRHGQGGGWYDRFLARVPDSWLRVGFCFTDQFSPTLLTRNAWDQPMDYVCVVDRASGTLTLYSSGRLGA